MAISSKWRSGKSIRVDRAVHGDQLADRRCGRRRASRAPYETTRDQQHARQEHLDRRDQRPHPGAADGGLAHLLGGARGSGRGRAPRRRCRAAPAARRPCRRPARWPCPPSRAGRRRAGWPGGAAAGRPARGPVWRRRPGRPAPAGRRPGRRRSATSGEGRRGEAGQGLDEPADLLDVAGGDGDHFTGGDPPGQRRAQFGGLAGEQLLHPGRGGDPVGDGGPVEHRVADRDERRRAPRSGRRPARAARRRGRRRPGPRGPRRAGGRRCALSASVPRQGLELAAELLRPSQRRKPGPERTSGTPGSGYGRSRICMASQPESW